MSAVRPGRHVPERSCAGCRAARPKRELIRLVAEPVPAGAVRAVRIDPSGRLAGRGAYLCGDTAAACLERARRRRGLSRALRLGDAAVDLEPLALALVNLDASDRNVRAPEVSSSPR